MKCQIQKHQNNNAEYICLLQTCINQESFCKVCLNETHNNHKEQCVSLSDLNEFINNRYFNHFEQQFKQKIDQQKDFLSRSFTLLRQQNYNLIQRNQILEILSLFDAQSKILLLLFDNGFKQVQEMYDQITKSIQCIKQVIQNNQQQDYERKNQNDNINQIIQSQNKSPAQFENIYQQNLFEQRKSAQEENLIQTQLNENKKLGKQTKYIQTLYDRLDFLKMNGQRFENSHLKHGQSSKNLCRIEELVQGPIKFFPNQNAENVFAGNGKYLQYFDISEGQMLQEDFKQFIILMANFCPEKIKQIFINQEINEQSYYMTRIYSLNERKYIYLELDDQVEPQKKLLIGSNNSIWIHLLWNTINKVVDLQSSAVELIKMSIVPVPILVYINTEDHLLEKLEEEVKQQAFILAKENTENNGNSFVQILGFYSVQNPLLGEETMLVKLRSPMSKYLYNGDWGFQSPYWTDDMLIQLKVSEDDDGIYFMDFFNFMNDFKYFTSQRIQAKLAFKEQCILKPKQGNYFKLNIEKTTELIFQLYYKEIKHLGYPIQSITIGKVVSENQNQNYIIKEDSKFEYYDSKQQVFPHSYKIKFTPGIYLVYLRVRFNQEDKFYNCSIRAFGESPAQFQQISKISSFKDQITMSQIQNKIQTNQGIVRNQFLKMVVQFQIVDSFFYIQNISNQEIKVKVEFQLMNCKLSKPFRGNSAEQKLKKSEYFFILIKKLDFTAQYKYQIMINDQLMSY